LGTLPYMVMTFHMNTSGSTRVWSSCERTRRNFSLSFCMASCAPLFSKGRLNSFVAVLLNPSSQYEISKRLKCRSLAKRCKNEWVLVPYSVVGIRLMTMASRLYDKLSWELCSTIHSPVEKGRAFRITAMVQKAIYRGSRRMPYDNRVSNDRPLGYRGL